MNKEEILVEISKWKDPIFFTRIINELKEYISQLDKIMYLRYIKLIESFNMTEVDKKKLYKYFFNKGLIDLNGKLINNPSIVITDDPRVVLSKYTKSGIEFSQNGYKLFYNAYLIFASGNKEGVRDFDYSQSLSNLPELSETEILYWCYYHNYTYQEFFKSIITHENVHKWTVNIDAPGDVIHTFLDECMVELESRKISSLNGINHIPLFRNKEINIFNEFTKGFPEELINYCLLTCDTNRLIDYFFSMHLNSTDKSWQEYYQRLADIIAPVAIGKDSNYGRAIIDKFNSLCDIINWEKPLDDSKIINEIIEFKNMLSNINSNQYN